MALFYVVTHNGKMKKIIIGMLACALAVGMEPKEGYDQADRETRAYAKKEVDKFGAALRSGDMPVLARYTDHAIEATVGRAVAEFRKRGEMEMADQVEGSYRLAYAGYLEAMVMGRGQGDHKALVQWMVDVYRKSVSLIGPMATQMLHISDLATFSWSIPVVFSPCTFSMDAVAGGRLEEYRRHFSKDDTNDKLYGLVPVVTYWVVDLAVMAAGLPFVSGIAASAGEFIMGKWIAPKLSDKIYTKNCPALYNR